MHSYELNLFPFALKNMLGTHFPPLRVHEISERQERK